jgi:hypothetical protein
MDFNSLTLLRQLAGSCFDDLLLYSLQCNGENQETWEAPDWSDKFTIPGGLG